jgi:hypothetical protein
MRNSPRSSTMRSGQSPVNWKVSPEFTWPVGMKVSVLPDSKPANVPVPLARMVVFGGIVVWKLKLPFPAQPFPTEARLSDKS